MGMRVSGAGSSAAMATWQAQQQSAAPAAAKPASNAGAVQAGAEQKVSAALAALATGTSVSKMA